MHIREPQGYAESKTYFSADSIKTLGPIKIVIQNNYAKNRTSCSAKTKSPSPGRDPKMTDYESLPEAYEVQIHCRQQYGLEPSPGSCYYHTLLLDTIDKNSKSLPGRSVNVTNSVNIIG